MNQLVASDYPLSRSWVKVKGVVIITVVGHVDLNIVRERERETELTERDREEKIVTAAC